MSVRLREQGPGLLLEGVDGVGAGGPAQRRLGLARELDERLGELGGVTSLWRLTGPGVANMMNVI